MTIVNKLLIAGVIGMLPITGIAQELKIAVVNLARIMDEAPQSKIALQKLGKEFAGRDSKLMDAQKAIKKLEDKLVRDSAIMSEAQRRKKERDIVSAKRDLRRSQDELREDRNFRVNEERGKLLRYVNDAITTVGKEKKFDLILYEGIAYANEAIDLTDMILKRLQNEAKANKK